MFTQAASIQFARLWLFAMGFIAFAALLTFTFAMPRLAPLEPTASASMGAQPAGRSLTRPLPTVFADGSCGNGAYITGDLAGDASPSSVYAALCPR
jgi:hypothetical protein